MLRPRLCRPDRHVQPDQGAGRGARRSPCARVPLRPRRQGGEGHAAAGHGPRHAAQVLLRAASRSTSTASTPAGELRDMVGLRCRRRPGRRGRPGPRGPPPPGRDPRRRGGDHRSSLSPSTSRSSASRRRASPIEEAPVVTQYEMHGVEDLGLLKMDFLGLRNLGRHRGLPRPGPTTPSGVVVDIDAVDLEDPPTYELLQAGRHDRRVPVGVGHRCAPSSGHWPPPAFDDVAALVALYRPGPMAANMHNDYADRKNGRKPDRVLPRRGPKRSSADTYGLMVYQESVMRVAQKFAGYSLADADLLAEVDGQEGSARSMAKEREKLRRRRAWRQGYRTSRSAVDLFDIIAQFADYAFTKSPRLRLRLRRLPNRLS